MAFKNFENMVFETGNVTTDINGEITVTIECIKSPDIPCIVATPYDVDGNSVANVTDVKIVGGNWTAKIITSSPNIKVRYHAFKTTAGDLNVNLITQDLFDILTQDGELILPL